MALSPDTNVIDEIKSRIPKPKQFTEEFEQYIRDRMKDSEVISFVSPAHIREDKILGLGVDELFEERMRLKKGFVVLTDQNLYTLVPKMCSVYRKESLPKYYEDDEITRRLTGIVFPRKTVNETLRIYISKRDVDAFISKIEKMGMSEWIVDSPLWTFGLPQDSGD